MTKLLSIIVPTKNRYEYLTYFVDLFYSIKDQRIELIIQDNSNIQSETFINKLNEITDDRIKYFYIKKSISVIDNCNSAVANSSGEFVSMLGDDDGFIPELISWVALIKEKGIEVLITEKAQYSWPDITHKHHNLSGFLSFKFPDQELISVDAIGELKKCLNYGGTFMFNMPRVYHGVVSRAILNKVFNTTGSYFPGSSPDMANAVALSLLNPITFYLNRPVIISGKGYKSTGGQGLRRGHIGKLEDIAHLPSDTIINWDQKIPKIWTGQTIYADSIINSLKRCGRVDLLDQFNYIKNYANLVGKHYYLFGMVFEFIKWYKYPLFLWYFLEFMILRFKNYIQNTLRTKLLKQSNGVSVRNISTIIECADNISAKINI